MIYKGTDRDAFERASKGLTKKSRSRKYQKYKAQKEKKRERESALPSFAQSTYVPQILKQPIKVQPPAVKTTQYRQPAKYVKKKTILDDIRDYRSSKIVSNVSNSLATFIIRCGGRQWDNDTRNIVRSSIALAISEVTNKVLERPLKIIDNIKLFIKVGKTIYKITAWIDKITNLWVTDDKSIGIVAENDIEYVSYIREYPRLTESFRSTSVEINSMKYKVGDIVLLTDGRTVCIINVNITDKIYCAVSTTEDKKEYVITGPDIIRLY